MEKDGSLGEVQASGFWTDLGVLAMRAAQQQATQLTKERIEEHLNYPMRAYLGLVSTFPLLRGAEEEAALASAIEVGRFAHDLLALGDFENQEIMEGRLMEALLRRADVLTKSRQPAQTKKRKNIQLKASKVTPANHNARGKLRNAPFEPETETRKGREVTVAKLLEWAQSLGPQEVSDLQELVRQGKEAFDRFLWANLRLVVPVAGLYAKKGLSFEELLQEGNRGLIRAVEKFDYQMGYKFSTHAMWWIRQAITQAFQNQARIIRYPSDIEMRINKVRNARRKLAQTLGREPDVVGIANYLTKGAKDQRRQTLFTVNDVRELLEFDRPVVSLDAPVFVDSPLTLHDILAEQSSAPVDRAKSEKIRQALEASLPALRSKEQEVARMLFGLPPYECQYRPDEIAAKHSLLVATVLTMQSVIKSKLACSPFLQALL